MTSPTAVAREWDLFVDWCHAHQRRALPADIDTVSRFAQSVSGSPSTIKHRLWSIARTHARAGFGLELTQPTTPIAWRTGERWPTAGEVLSRIPIHGWTRGYRGRRDVVLIVAIGVLGLSRRVTTALAGADVIFDGRYFYLAGRLVPRHRNAGECPSCAIARWLPLLPAIESWSRADAQQIVMSSPGPTAGDCTEHCCQQIAGPSWPKHVPLLPSIDRYGYAGDALTSRAVSAIISRTQTEICKTAPNTSDSLRYAPDADRGRFSNYSMNDLFDALDELDDAADRAARDSSEVLGAATMMASYVASLRPIDRPAPDSNDQERSHASPTES